MQHLWIRRLAIAIFALNAVAVVWPISALFGAAEPLILGLPLSMAWPIGWIVIGWLTLLVLNHFEERAEPT